MANTQPQAPLVVYASRTVSRVLFRPITAGGGHLSTPMVAHRLQRPTRGVRGPRHSPPAWSCCRWGLPSRPVTRPLVRSYRTFSPLPAIPVSNSPVAVLPPRQAVCFCGTSPGVAPAGRYPASCPMQPGLSSNAAPYARQALAATRPTRMNLMPFKLYHAR